MELSIKNSKKIGPREIDGHSELKVVDGALNVPRGSSKKCILQMIIGRLQTVFSTGAMSALNFPENPNDSNKVNFGTH